MCDRSDCLTPCFTPSGRRRPSSDSRSTACAYAWRGTSRAASSAPCRVALAAAGRARSTSPDYGPFAFSRVLTPTPSSLKRSEPMGLPALRPARTNGEPLGYLSQMLPNVLHNRSLSVLPPPPGRPRSSGAGGCGRKTSPRSWSRR